MSLSDLIDAALTLALIVCVAHNMVLHRAIRKLRPLLLEGRGVMEDLKVAVERAEDVTTAAKGGRK